MWFDHELSGGQAWWDHILEKVRQCDVFVFLLDPAALNSTACIREFGYADTLGKPILPILVSADVSTNLLPPALSKIHFVDYRDQDLQAGLRLAKALRSLPSPSRLPDPLPTPPEAPISYLESLAEQVETTSTLGYEQQSVLVVDLKRSLRDPGSSHDTRILLEKMRNRRDLNYWIAKEIDELLGSAEKVSSAPPQVAETERSFHEDSSQDSRKEMRIPDNMVLIPKGPFLYGENRGRGDIPYDYYMGIYPVTNDQYEDFILANGYGTKAHWSEEGWKWKKEKMITQPEYWNDSKWNKPDHPVVGVSYYEAEAYATWAGKRLPTEQEWEKAARGTDGREYPWGDAFDQNKCNSNESGIGSMTPVTKYDKGVSPFGCYDMAGNVWEWCADWYDKEAGGLRVLRGGAWNNKPENLRSSTRVNI